MTYDNEGPHESTTISFFNATTHVQVSTLHLPPTITTVQVSDAPQSMSKSDAQVIIFALEQDPGTPNIISNGLYLKFSVTSESILEHLAFAESSVMDIQSTPDETWLLTSSNNKHHVTIWDLRQDDDAIIPLFSLSVPGQEGCWSAIFNHETRNDGSLATCDESDESIYFWDIARLRKSDGNATSTVSLVSREVVNTPGPAVLAWGQEETREWSTVPLYTDSKVYALDADSPMIAVCFDRSVLVSLHWGSGVKFYNVNHSGSSELKSMRCEDVRMRYASHIFVNFT